MKVVYNENGVTYLERYVYGTREDAERVARELNEKENTDKYYVKD